MTKSETVGGRMIRFILRNWDWVALLIAMLFVAVIRLRALQVPLERDEGEYAYAGQLILQGIPPYSLACNMKLPGVYAAYALVMAVFGQTTAGIHLGLLLVNLATILLVFLLARRLMGPLAGVAAGVSYGFLSMGEPVYGLHAHATHFVILPAMGGTLLLLRAIDSGKTGTLFWSGLLMGLAFIMKQHGVLFIAFGLAYLLWSLLQARPVQWKTAASKVAAFCLGASVPLAAVCITILAAGVFQKFWFWTVKYAGVYVSEASLNEGKLRILDRIPKLMMPAIALWGLAGIGLVTTFLDKSIRKQRVFVVGFVLFAILSTCPGMCFRPHYYITMLPAVALLIGIAVTSANRLIASMKLPSALHVVPVLLFVVALTSSAIQQQRVLFEMTPFEICRDTYGASPFPESVEIAKYIRKHSDKDDRIAVLGSEPQIYFYSHRRSATGYVYSYALMEKQQYALRMQEEMIRQIEEARPRYIVLVHVDTSWMRHRGSPVRIINWYEKYLPEHYDVVGVVDMLSLGYTNYLWDDEIANYTVESDHFLLVFERKAG